MVSNRQVRYIAARELNCELGVNRGICGRHRRDKGAGIIGG